MNNIAFISLPILYFGVQGIGTLKYDHVFFCLVNVCMIESGNFISLVYLNKV